MKLYDVTAAPNPRRVRIFIAEKGIEVPTQQVDMRAGEQRTPAYLRMNPSGKIPVLETDDGEFIAESVAICRYLEALHPEPNLFGATPVELGQIEMNNRILELELWNPIGVSWVNGPVVAQIAAGRFKQNQQAKETGDKNTHRFYERLNKELASRDYMAGSRFTVADITALTAIDFATELVGLKPEENLDNLWKWHKRVTERPSAKA